MAFILDKRIPKLLIKQLVTQTSLTQSPKTAGRRVSECVIRQKPDRSLRTHLFFSCLNVLAKKHFYETRVPGELLNTESQAFFSDVLDIMIAGSSFSGKECRTSQCRTMTAGEELTTLPSRAKYPINSIRLNSRLTDNLVTPG